ncbi:MAG: radical SAM protein, partial [Gammaproteobacteria bacterium]|nr:radical SAM protein [Gammaproteobacteria bacterium]
MSDLPIKPSKPTRGRGAVTNHPSRFLAAVVEPQGDDWGDGLDIQEHWQARSTKVQVKPDLTKRLITTNRSPDIPFEQSINPYKGCEHGCIYCFAR